MRGGWLVAWTLYLTLATSVQAQESEVYEPLIDGAVEAFVRGEWAQSRALFERAQAVRPNARALRGLGMADFNLHAYARATVELEHALRSEVAPLDAELRAQVEALLSRAQPFVARLTLELAPAHATLSVDYAPPLRDAQARVLLDLGEHTLRVEAAEHTSRVERYVVRSGGDAALSLAAAPVLAPSVRRGVRLARWLTFAAGIAAIGAGVGTRLGSNHRFDDLERACRARAGCLDGDADLGPVRRLERASYASFGIGAALTASAFLWWLFEPRTRSP